MKILSGPRIFGLPWRMPLAMFAGVGLLVSYAFGIQDKPLFTLGFGPEPVAAPPAITAVGAGCVERWNASPALGGHRRMLAARGALKFSVTTFGVDGPGTEFPRGTCGVAIADAGFRTLAVFAAIPGGDYVDITRSSWTQMVPLQDQRDVNAAMRPDGRLESVIPVPA